MKRDKIKILFFHFLYWMGIVLVFALIWGSYDDQYIRNFFVQLWSLPARMILSYLSILVLIPQFLDKKKYTLFSLSFILFLGLIVMFIQRPIIYYLVEDVFLPYRSASYFNLVEMVNTGIDVAIGTVPLLFLHQSMKRNSNEIKKEFDYLIINEGQKRHKVYFDDILFIESQRNVLLTQTSNTSLKSYGNMASIEEKLPSTLFMRVHRSFIVNIKKVDSFSATELVISQNQIPIGRKYKDAVRARLEELFSSPN